MDEGNEDNLHGFYVFALWLFGRHCGFKVCLDGIVDCVARGVVDSMSGIVVHTRRVRA